MDQPGSGLARRIAAIAAAWACALFATHPAVAAIPGAPTNVLAIPGNARATIHLAPPASDGGFPITQYTVTASPGNATASGAGWPIVVTGLANGTSYTFTVRATNASGQGPASAPSNPVTPVLPTITPAVVTAETVTMALDVHGQVYAWGADDNGQLGQGRPLVQNTPVRVPGLPPIQHIAVNDHALAVDTSGQVWAWGDGSCGQLGPRDSGIGTKPARVTGATGMTRVAAGACTSYALKADGTVWQWGPYGQPLRQVPGLSGITDISARGYHLLALRNDATVWAQGQNNLGQLGIGNKVDQSTAVPVPLPGVTAVTAISAGAYESFAIVNTATTTGELRFWGRFDFGTEYLSPVAVTGLGGVATAISVIEGDILAVRSGGTVWKWALNLTTPVQVAGFTGAARVEHCDNFGRINTLLSINASGALTATGNNNNGQLGQGHTNPVAGVVAVPGFASGTVQARLGMQRASVLALKGDGSVWFWGQNATGLNGDGRFIGSSVPLAVPIPATISSIAVGLEFSVALDTAGRLWGWGSNKFSVFDSANVNRPSPALVAGATGIAAIAAGGSNNIVFAKVDGTAWRTSGGAFVQATGIAGIVKVAANYNNQYFLRNDGALFAMGMNLAGEVGDGTRTVRGAPVPVIGITGAVAKVATQGSLVGALTTDGRVYAWGLGGGIANSPGVTTPFLAPGIANAVDIAVARSGMLIRLADGRVFGWGYGTYLPGQVDSNPFPVSIPDGPLKAMALDSIGFSIGKTGLLRGWGLSGVPPTYGTVGDGTYIARSAPVVVFAHDGSGSLDAANWFLDLEPASAESIPAADVPSAIATAQLFGVTQAYGLRGIVKYRATDLGKRVKNYVLALVPPAFFNQVKSSPGLSSKASLQAKAAKNGGFVVAQLTPSGWEDVGFDLVAYSSGVASAAGSASNILNGINASLIPGSRFCVGYGESADAMLSSLGLREVLAVGGASATPSGVPCVLSGIYLNGPPSSVHLSPASFTATVVGVAPGGTVQFKDSVDSGPYLDLGGAAILTASNPAVSSATFTSSALALGTHSIGALYSGDGLNAPLATETPRIHTVLAQPSVALESPASSALESEVSLVATVTGRSPTGSVQFRASGAPLGSPVALVGGVASLWIAFSSTGTFDMTAEYSGDGGNAPATSAPRTHLVREIVRPSAALASSANPAAFGQPVTLTATVTGASPTGGTLSLYDGPTLTMTTTLSNGSASFAVGALPAGVHRFTAHYAGDPANLAVTSPTFVQEVLAPPESFTLSVARSGSGSGRVTSSPAGIDCGAACAFAYTSGTVVILTPTPSSGSLFAGWTGNCTGSGACSVTVNTARNVGATFDLQPPGALSANPATLDFGGQSMNTTSAELTTTLTNPSALAVTITGVTASAGFAVRSNSCATLAAAASCGIGVTFTPPVANATAPVNGSLTVSHAGGPTTVALQGIAERTLVAHYYGSILRRLPDAGGRTYWTAEAQRVANLGASVNEVWYAMAQAFYFSAEYLAFLRSDTGFVTDLYTTFFNRAPDAPGLAFWVGNLGQGMPREVALAEFMFSTEFRNFAQAIFGNNTARAEVNTVLDFYRGLLARIPDDGGYDYWVRRFRAAQCLGTTAITNEVEAISSAFALSPEYAARNRSNAQYVGDLYNAFLRRGGDLPGVLYWIGRLDSRALTREQLRAQFKDSTEFQLRVQAIIAQGCMQ